MLSVVIRARNEAKWLGRCLYALSNQRLAIDDVILVNNASTDGTLDVAKSYGARIVDISPAEFSFGR